jgi:Flp pilus assembly protein TadB
MASSQIMSDPRQEDNRLPTGHPRRRLVPNFVWVCVAVGVIAAVTVLILFGPSLWTLLGIFFLIACPAMAVWVLSVERGYRSTTAARKK